MDDSLTPDYCDRHYNLVPPAEIERLLMMLDARSAEVRAQSSVELDVRYGTDVTETLDVFRPAGRSRGVLIFIHGGLWQFGDKSQFSFPAAAWTAAGLTYVAINYGLAPRVTIETQVAQCRRATAFVHRHASELGTGAGNLCIAGHSSGGHLAAMVMTTRWSDIEPGLPDAMLTGGVTLSGVHDLEAIRRTAFLNAVLKLDQRRAADSSPVHRRPAAGLRLCAAVGELENEEFQRQTRVLCEAWASAPHRHLVVPGVDHFTILDHFADRDSVLFGAAAALLA